MKNLKKILFSINVIFLCTAPLTARHKKHDYTEQLLDAVKNHEPLKIDYNKIINPKEIGLSNPDALKIEPKRLSHEEKVKKYDTDKELRNIFNRHATGLLNGQILTSKQSLNFFNMSIKEQQELMQKWLKDHNVYQNNQLKEASKNYREEIKNFKGSTQYNALKKVTQIQNKMAERDEEIKNLQKQIDKGNLSKINRQQKQEEIRRLTQQNKVDDTSIQKQLSDVFTQLVDIDKNFVTKCNEIIQMYQQKNHEILNTVNRITTSQNQRFSLKTADKDLPPTTSLAANSNKESSKIAAMPENSESYILSTPKSEWANNPMLNKIIERHEKDLANMKRNNPDYAVMKKELNYLKEARKIRDIQGTAIN